MSIGLRTPRPPRFKTWVYIVVVVTSRRFGSFVGKPARTSALHLEPVVFPCSVDDGNAEAEDQRASPVGNLAYRRGEMRSCSAG